MIIFKGDKSMEYAVKIPIILSILAAIYIESNHFKHVTIRDRYAACMTNVRVIIGAVEMYNMDNKELMRELDIGKLVEGRYLKTPPYKHEVDCDYFGDKLDSNEDFNDLIYCKRHGTITQFDLKKKQEQREKKLKSVFQISLIIAGIVAIILI